VRKEFLPFSPPFVGEEEVEAAVQALRSGWITTGPRAKEFETAFAARLGAPGALALSSCTAALHTALVTLGIGPGDEVVTTPITFAASANVIEHTGARPVFVDVEPDTLNLDPAAARAAVTPRTKAILPVHFTGHPCEMDAIHALASEHGLAVVEDAAHALPARYRGKLVGSSANPVAFSFYATKNLTTAEGGMLTGEPTFLDRARVVALHGMSRDAWRRYERGGSWRYDIELPGFKYNMPDLLAAIGLVQLRRLEAMQKRREEVVAAYAKAFAGHAALEVPVRRSHVDPAWHLYVLRLRLDRLTIDRDTFLEKMREQNIGCSVHFIPLHTQPFYRRKYKLQPDDFPVAYGNFTRMLSLPLHPGLTDQDVADVADAVLEVASRHAR